MTQYISNFTEYNMYLEVDRHFNSYKYIPARLSNMDLYTPGSWFIPRLEELLEVAKDGFLWALLLVLKRQRKVYYEMLEGDLEDFRWETPAGR